MSDKNEWLLVRVTDLKTGKKKANVNIPVSLADFGLKMAARFAPMNMENLDMNIIIEEIRNSGEKELAHVEDRENGELIEIFLN